MPAPIIPKAGRQYITQAGFSLVFFPEEGPEIPRPLEIRDDTIDGSLEKAYGISVPADPPAGSSKGIPTPSGASPRAAG